MDRPHRKSPDFPEVLVYVCCPHTATTTPLTDDSMTTLLDVPSKSPGTFVPLSPLAVVYMSVLDHLFFPSPGFLCCDLCGRGLYQKHGWHQGTLLYAGQSSGRQPPGLAGVRSQSHRDWSLPHLRLLVFPSLLLFLSSLTVRSF